MNLPKSDFARAVLFECILVLFGYLWEFLSPSPYGFWFGWLFYALVLEEFMEVALIMGVGGDLIVTERRSDS